MRACKRACMHACMHTCTAWSTTHAQTPSVLPGPAYPCRARMAARRRLCPGASCTLRTRCCSGRVCGCEVSQHSHTPPCTHWKVAVLRRLWAHACSRSLHAEGCMRPSLALVHATRHTRTRKPTCPLHAERREVRGLSGELPSLGRRRRPDPFVRHQGAWWGQGAGARPVSKVGLGTCPLRCTPSPSGCCCRYPTRLGWFRAGSAPRLLLQPSHSNHVSRDPLPLRPLRAA